MSAGRASLRGHRSRPPATPRIFGPRLLARMAPLERRSLIDEHKQVPMVDLGNLPENLEGRVADNPELLQAVAAELRENEERYRAVVEQAAEGILLVDVDSKRVLEANAAYQDLLGYSPEEILRLSLYDLVPYPPESMDCYARRVREQRSYVSGERRHRRKDGSLVDVEASANVISYGGREAMCIVVRDISGRKRTEEALRKSESSLAAAQRIAHLGNFDYDVERDVARWSDELYRIFGFAPQQFVPTYKSFLGSVHPDDRQSIRRAVREALYEGREDSIEYRILRPNGDARVVHTRFEVVRGETGGPIGLIGTVQDVTERKRAEEEIRELNQQLEQRVRRRTAQLEAFNRELEAFSYSVSHDLRAPLRGIDGFSQILLEDYADDLDEEGKDYLGRVRGASQRMGRLIDDLLDLSRMTRNEMRRERVDLSALAEGIAEELERAQPERRVEFVVKGGLVAEGDGTLLRVAL